MAPVIYTDKYLPLGQGYDVENFLHSVAGTSQVEIHNRFDEDVAAALRMDEKLQQYAEHFNVAQHNGFVGVGLGWNVKDQRRGARLALAAGMFVNGDSSGHVPAALLLDVIRLAKLYG